MNIVDIARDPVHNSLSTSAHDPKTKWTIFIAVKDGKVGYTFSRMENFFPDAHRLHDIPCHEDFYGLYSRLFGDDRPRFNHGEAKIGHCAQELLRLHINQQHEFRAAQR